MVIEMPGPGVGERWGSRPRRRNMVVVLEDNGDTRAALQRALQNEGYDVFATADGEEALARLALEPAPCVVLLDLYMPGMSGDTFYRRLKSDPAITAVPVIVVTAAPPEHRKAFGTTPVIRKPINLDELRYAMARVTSCQDDLPESSMDS